MTGFSSKRIPPSSSTSPKEMGICSVERGVGSTTSHTKQNLFDALKRVSLACKNRANSDCMSSAHPTAQVLLHVWFWSLKQKKKVLLGSDSPYIFLQISHWQRTRKWKIKPIFLDKAYSQPFPMFCTVLAAAACSRDPAPLPALHTLCSPSRKTDTTWKCFHWKPHGFIRLYRPYLLVIASHFSEMSYLLPIRVEVGYFVSLIVSWIWFCSLSSMVIF